MTISTIGSEWNKKIISAFFGLALPVRLISTALKKIIERIAPWAEVMTRLKSVEPLLSDKKYPILIPTIKRLRKAYKSTISQVMEF